RSDSVTGKRNAVRNKSGQPVDHSGPGLEVRPTIPNTAGLNPAACPPILTLSLQPKSGQGFGDRVPVGGNAAAPSSLDPIRSNRNRPTKRKPYCGCFTL